MGSAAPDLHMVESMSKAARDDALSDFAASASSALAAGVSKEKLLATLKDHLAQVERPHPYPPPEGEGKECVYDVLPAGLIDLPSASAKHDVNSETIRRWIEKGHVRLVGRLRGPARGGGFLVVDECELVAYKNSPKKKGGRPRKTD